MHCIFDCDGVLALYGTNDFIPPDFNYLKPGYFEHRPPDRFGIELIKQVIDAIGPERVFIISSISGDISYTAQNRVIQEKTNWIKQHIPEFNINHFRPLRLSHTVSKARRFNLHELNKTDTSYILIDDYNPNLIDWQTHGGIAVKYLNGINSPLSFPGLQISNRHSLEQALDVLAQANYQHEIRKEHHL